MIAFYETSRKMLAPFGLNALVLVGNMRHIISHWQDGLELLLPLKGRLMVLIEKNEFVIEPGGIIAIPPGLVHEVWSESADSVQLVFDMDPGQLRHLEKGHIWFSTSGRFATPLRHPDVCQTQRRILSLAKLFYAYFPEEERSAPQMVSNEDWYTAHIEMDHILRILARHIVSGAPLRSKLPVSATFQRCLQYVHTRYTDSITALEVAQALGYSESTVYRMFRTYTGVSFLEYLTSVRLQAACGLLARKQSRILEVALDSGFSSLSNFYRVFREHYGMTPAEYQNQVEAGMRNLLEQDAMRQFNIWGSFAQLGYSWEELDAMCCCDEG